jgi:hypothetical protein
MSFLVLPMNPGTREETMIRCPACKGENPSTAERCEHCGVKFIRKPRPVEVEINEEDETPEAVQVKRPVEAEEEFHEVQAVRPKPKRRRVIAEDDEDDGGAGGAIIPYRNPLALFGYYAAFLGLAIALGGTAVAIFLLRQKEVITMPDVNTAKTIIWIGMILGILVELVAFVMGIFGFFYAKTYRSAQGGGHALSAIIMGALFLIGEIIFLMLVIQYVDTNFKPFA